MNNASQPPIKGLVVIIASLAMIGPFSIDAYLPSFPAIESEFGVSRAILSQTIALYLITFSIAALIGGSLADSIGRRPVIIGALLIYIIASLFCAVSSNYNIFLLARLFQGVGAGICLVVGRTIARDIYNFQDALRVMAHVLLALSLAPAIAPIIGGWLHEFYGWRSVFYFLSFFGFILSIAYISRVPETITPEHCKAFSFKETASFYLDTLTYSRFVYLMLIITCMSGSLFIYLVGSPTVIFNFLNLDVRDFYILFVPIVAGMTLGAWVSGKVSQRCNPLRTITIALTIMFIASVFNLFQSLWASSSVIFTVLPLIFISFGIGVSGPVIMLLAMDCFPKNRSSASGILGFVQTFGHAILTSAILPLLITYSYYFALAQLILMTTALTLWWKLPFQRDS